MTTKIKRTVSRRAILRTGSSLAAALITACVAASPPASAATDAWPFPLTPTARSLIAARNERDAALATWAALPRPRDEVEYSDATPEWLAAGDQQQAAGDRYRALAESVAARAVREPITLATIVELALAAEGCRQALPLLRDAVLQLADPEHRLDLEAAGLA